MNIIVIFDFLSHDFMHHPFNEGYIRLVRESFPEDEVIFFARPGHIERLRPHLADVDKLTFRACDPFSVPFGLSRHNPFGGYLGARHCISQIAEVIAGQTPPLVSVLGVDANLLGTLRRVWPSLSNAPLHMILHNHLGEAFRWRTRNPIYRRFDFRSMLGTPLGPRQRLIALELGIKEALLDQAPAMAGCVETLEHPILTSDWVAERQYVEGDKLKIGFLGHASTSKGFDTFMEIARKAGPEAEFHAIGIGSPEALAMDLSVLARPPAKTSVPRDEYVEAMRQIDAVCLPLSSGYDYVASGSVIDAIAGLKPLFCLRNRSVDGIFSKYGPIGYLAEKADELVDFVLHRAAEENRLRREEWVGNLKKARDARTPAALAPAYGGSVRRLKA